MLYYLLKTLKKVHFSDIIKLYFYVIYGGIFYVRT